MEVQSPEEWAVEYAARRPLHAEFCRRVEALMTDLLISEGIPVLQIEARTKSVDSFREKLQRKKLSAEVSPFSEIHDLVGVRVVTYYLEDVRRVSQVVDDHFQVDAGNSESKSEGLSSDQFGYLSTHFVAELNSERAALPEWQAYSGMRAEIQVRTVLQHAWAAVSHKLDYKAAEDAPDLVRRRLYRLSALFEMADEQFSVIRDEMLEVDSEYRASVGQGDLNIPLDAASLAAYLSLSKKADVVAELMRKYDNSDESVDDDRRARDKSDLLAVLNQFGMKSLIDLDQFLARKRDLERAAKSLMEADGGFGDLTLEDWITQLIVIMKDTGDRPGAPYYNEQAIATFKKAKSIYGG